MAKADQNCLNEEMGASAQQHRVVTGCFDARLWSSGWTPGSSGRARCSESWETRRRTLQGSSLPTPSCLWRILITLNNLMITAMPMIIGPVVVFSVTGSTVRCLAMTSQQGCVMGLGVTSPIVISNTTWLMLLLSGDMESNPEPGVVAQGYEQCLVEGLAKLCRAAPTETVRSGLGVWNLNKPGNQIRSRLLRGGLSPCRGGERGI